MRKIPFLIAAVLAVSATAAAEDILQILPQRIEKGSTSDDARTFAIQLVNESQFCALEFDLYLPEGMEFDDIDPIEMNPDRFPHTTGRGGVIKYDHTVGYSKRPGGFYRVQVGFADADKVNSKISGNSGDLFTIYYVTDAALADGPLPVEIKNVTFAISGTQGIYPPTSSSYFYSGDFDLATATTLDLSGLTGYMTVDVVNATNHLIATNQALAEINLENLEDMGAALSPANSNCSVFMDKNSSAYAIGVTQGNLICVDEGDYKCGSLELVDGYAFSSQANIQCGNITYQREFIFDGWQALFLPFDVNINALNGQGKFAKIKEVDADSESDILVWELVNDGILLANTPFIWKPENTGSVTLAVSDAMLKATNDIESIQMSSPTLNGYKLSGTYVTKTDMYSSNSYALANGNFHPASSDAITLQPFRIYLNITPSGSQMPKIRSVVVDGTDFIEALTIDSPNQLEIGNIYDLSGRKVNNPVHGVYIMQNKKIIYNK